MALNCKNLYRIGPRSTISLEGGGQKAERGKVRGIFSRLEGGGRRTEADEKRRKNFPLITPIAVIISRKNRNITHS